jgi:predicted MFS family arabinose efflux permease
MKTDNGPDGREFRKRWIILGVIYLCVLAFAVAFQALPPVLSIVMAELKLSHAQGGLLMSFFALPGILISIPAGMLADRYNQSAIGSIAIALIIAGASIFALGQSMRVLALGRLVSGAGALTLVVLAPQLIAQWFTGREIGIAMGVFNTGMPLGTILSLNFLSLIGERLGWRVSIWSSVGMSLLAFVAFLFLFTPAPRKGELNTTSPEPFFRGFRSAGASIWIVGLAWMFYNAAVISMYTFTPDLLKANGFSLASAGFYVSLFVCPGLFLAPLLGYLTDKINHKRTIIAVGGVIISCLVVWIPTATTWLAVLLVLVGISQTMVPTPIFALVPDVIKPERLGLGFGIIMTCVNLGIVVGPFATGLIRDVTGSYQGSYFLMAGFSLLITVSMAILGRRESPRPTAIQSP